MRTDSQLDERYMTAPAQCWVLVFGCLEPRTFFAYCRPVCSAWRASQAAWPKLHLVGEHTPKLVAACLPASLVSVEADEDTVPSEVFPNLRSWHLRLSDAPDSIWPQLPIEALTVQAASRLLWNVTFPPQHRIRTCRLKRTILVSPSLFEEGSLATLEMIDLNFADSWSFVLLLRAVTCLRHFMELSVFQKKRWRSLDLCACSPILADFLITEMRLWTEFSQGLEALKINFWPTYDVLHAVSSLTCLEIEDVPVVFGIGERLLKLRHLRLAFQKTGLADMHCSLVDDPSCWLIESVVLMCDHLPALESLVLRDLDPSHYTLICAQLSIWTEVVIKNL